MERINLVKITNTELTYSQLLKLADMLDCKAIENKGQITCLCDVEAEIEDFKTAIRDLFNIKDSNLRVTFSDIGKKAINKVSNTSLYVKNNNLEKELESLKLSYNIIKGQIFHLMKMTTWEFFINKFKKI